MMISNLVVEDSYDMVKAGMDVGITDESSKVTPMSFNKWTRERNIKSERLIEHANLMGIRGIQNRIHVPEECNDEMTKFHTAMDAYNKKTHTALKLYGLITYDKRQNCL